MAKTPSSVLGRPPLPKKFQIATTPAKIAAAAKAKAVPAAVPAMALKAKAELVKRMPELDSTVAALTVDTPEQYQEADEILGMIQTARKDWQTRFYGGESQGKLYDPIIPPLRSSLDALYALVREVDAPLGLLEERVKKLQVAYKRAELEAIREQEREQAEKRQQLERDRQAAQDALEAARTPRQKMAATAALSTMDTAAEVLEETYIDPVRAMNSASRVNRTWQHVDMKLTLRAILAGAIPLDVLQLNTAKIHAYYKEDAATVESWPGFEGFDDITIVGRRGR